MENAERILREFRAVAVVGLSRNPEKAAHSIPAKLQVAGFRVIPVNPLSPTLLGETSYARLTDVPFSVEVVLVFRPSSEAAELARSAVAIGAKALWLQQGIVSKDAREIAETAGLLYVEDRCIGVERAVLGIIK